MTNFQPAPTREPGLTLEQRAALERLLRIATRDTGQGRRVANFLLAWYNAEDNGGWNPADLWAVDAPIAADIMTVLELIYSGPNGKYPNDWGYRPEIEHVRQLWRGKVDEEEDDEAPAR